MEISHHYGIENLKVGCFYLIASIESMQKIIVMLPNQKHPCIFIGKKKRHFKY